MTLRMWSSLNESQKPRLHEKNGRFWSENVSFSRFCLVFFVFRGKFFLHFSIFLEKISKIHRKSCRALALDSVDLKNLSCCSIPRNDEDYLRRLIQKGKGDWYFGRCWRKPPDWTHVTPMTPDRIRKNRPRWSWPEGHFPASAVERPRTIGPLSSDPCYPESFPLRRGVGWPKKCSPRRRWSRTSYRPHCD